MYHQYSFWFDLPTYFITVVECRKTRQTLLLIGDPESFPSITYNANCVYTEVMQSSPVKDPLETLSYLADTFNVDVFAEKLKQYKLQNAAPRALVVVDLSSLSAGKLRSLISELMDMFPSTQ